MKEARFPESWGLYCRLPEASVGLGNIWEISISGGKVWRRNFSAGVYSFDSIFWVCIDYVGNGDRTYDEEEPGGSLFLLWQNGTI